MLSTTKYVALCVAGMEIFYVLCLGYGFLLSQKARELHQALFELIPGFAWDDPVRMVWGGFYMGVFALIFGWYVAWMHNTSLTSSAK
jgi:hypothetical protein